MEAIWSPWPVPLPDGMPSHLVVSAPQPPVVSCSRCLRTLRLAGEDVAARLAEFVRAHEHCREAT
jgi:hypothetical protein